MTATTPTREQIDLVKRTVMPKAATDDEVSLYFSFCQRFGLEPLGRHVYPVKRWDSQAGQEVMQFQVSIDGFRLKASRTGDYQGQTPTEWCADDGVWKDVWLSAKPPAAARVGVYRKEFQAPLYAVARFEAYAVRKRDGALTGMWQKMPDVMLAKVAESLALRKSFPLELGGVYTTDEMAQADNVPLGTVTKDDLPKKKAPKAELPPAPVVEDQGDAIDQATGEVLPEPPAEYDDLAPGLYVVECRPSTGDGRLVGTVTLHDTVTNEKTVCKVWEQPLYALAEAICQANDRVTVKTADSTRWGVTLKELHRVVTTSDNEPPPFTDADVPF